MTPNPPKAPQRDKAATKCKGKTNNEGGGWKATKRAVDKKERQLAAKGAAEGQPKGDEGKERRGGQQSRSVGAVPVGDRERDGGGDSERGRQKWVLFGTRETPYKVTTHLWYATEATSTAQWQKTTGGAEAT